MSQKDMGLNSGSALGSCVCPWDGYLILFILINKGIVVISQLIVKIKMRRCVCKTLGIASGTVVILIVFC